MCFGENNAVQATHYLNAQLAALWENSQDCAERHGNGLQPDVNYKYCFALSTFFHGKHRRGQASKADMMFYATFDKPRLEFMCNHDAVFRISLKEGHYNTEFTKSANNPANIEHNRAFTKGDVAFRVPFTVTGIRGQDLRLGDGDNLINLLVLELEKAHLISVSRELEGGREALGFYLSQYLKLLRNAGNHVLFSLPDFDDDRHRVTIDFSANAQALVDVDDIYGISVEKINTFLSSSWLKAAMLAGGKNGPSADRAAISLAEYRSTWVLGDSNVYFHVKLGAPRVRALCGQEVVLYFVIDEALFYDSQDFTVAAKQRYTDWEVAVLVNVIHQKEEDNNVTRCKLDLNTVRFMRQFCEFPGLDQNNEEMIRHLTRLVDFFTSDYLDVLESAQYHTIYHYDERWPKLTGIVGEAEHHEELEEESDSEEEEEEEVNEAHESRATTTTTTINADGTVVQTETTTSAHDATAEGAAAGHAVSRSRTTQGHAAGRIVAGHVVSARIRPVDYVSKASAWQELSEKTEMSGFDHVSAVSQAAINSYFKSVWTAAQNSKNAIDATLARWTYESYFSSTFQPITLRLLSNNRVLVWIHIQEGWLKTLKNWLPWSESEKYKFENWRLAFEVELKLAEHDKLEGVSTAWNARFEDSFVYKQHGKASDRVLKHIYLDFKHAEFVHEFSSFDGLFNSHDKRPIDKVQALVTYLQSHYFTQLVSSGYHVLYTLPIWKAGATLSANALTDVTFQIYSQTHYDRRNWGQVTKATEPVMLILGMTNFRALVSTHIKYSSNWIIRASKGISYGTICFSRSTFLDEKLLNLLARVNAITTIVTLPFALERGAWKLQLTTWAQSENRKGSACKWVLSSDAAGLLKYKWEHRDSWRYEHEGTADITNGAYSVDCYTKNYLEIPTVFKHGALEIRIRGEVFLTIGVKGNVQSWSAHSSAKWHTTLALQAECDGLKINVLTPPNPVYEKAKTEGDVVAAFYTSPETLLKANLPSTVDLGEIVGLFKSFEGIWGGIYPGTSAFTLAQPVFTKKGDIMFELRPHTQISASAPAVVRAMKHHSTSSTTTTRTTHSAIRPAVFSRPSLLQRVKNHLTGEKSMPVAISSPVAEKVHHHQPNGKATSGNGEAKPVASQPASPAPSAPATPAPAAKPEGKGQKEKKNTKSTNNDVD